MAESGRICDNLRQFEVFKRILKNLKECEGVCKKPERIRKNMEKSGKSGKIWKNLSINSV